MTTNYVPVRGSHLSEEDAQVWGEELEALSGGVEASTDTLVLINPAVVVEQARAVTHRLHQYLEWDDARAAAKYRIDQVRYYVRSVMLVRDDLEEPIRAFHAVSFTKDSEPVAGYAHLSVITKEEELMGQVVQRAARELQGWRDRYAQYEALARAVKAVENALVLIDADVIAAS